MTLAVPFRTSGAAESTRPQLPTAARRVHDTPELLAAIVDHIELTPPQLSVLRRTSVRLAADVQRPQRLPQAIRALEPCYVRNDERVVVTQQNEDFGPTNEIGVFGGELWRVKAPIHALSLGEQLFPRIRDRMEHEGIRYEDVTDLREGVQRFAREVRRTQGLLVLSFVAAKHESGDTKPLRCWDCDARRELCRRFPRLLLSALVVSGLTMFGLAAIHVVVAAAGPEGPADSLRAPFQGRLPRAPLSRWWAECLMVTAAIHLGLFKGGQFVRSFRASRNSRDIERIRRQMLINMDFADSRRLVHGDSLLAEEMSTH